MSMYYLLDNAKCEFFSLLPEWSGYCIVKWRHVKKHGSFFGRVKRLSGLRLPDYWNVFKCLFSAHHKDDTCKLGKCENLWHISMWFSDCSFGYNTFMLLKPLFLFKVFPMNSFKLYIFIFSSFFFIIKYCLPTEYCQTIQHLISFIRNCLYFLWNKRVLCNLWLGGEYENEGKI